MEYQSLCPYGLKSVMECISRATLLSQPTDIPEFILLYLSEMISFKHSHPEADPKLVSFHYQEQWEKKFLKNIRTTKSPVSTPETSAAKVPSPEEIKGALKSLYTDLASSTQDTPSTRLKGKRDKKTVPDKKTSIRQEEKDKKASVTVKPTLPPRVGRQPGKNVPPPFLVVKGEKKPAPPPADVSIKPRRVSSVRLPAQQLSKGTTEDKTPESRRPTTSVRRSLAPIKVAASQSSEACKSPKRPAIPIPVVTQNLVLPPIQSKTGKGIRSVVQGEGVPPKPRKKSPVNRKVVQKTTDTAKPRSTKNKKEPVTDSPKKPKVPEPNKKIQPHESPERDRGQRVLWTERERVKPILDRTVGGIQGKAFGKPASVAGGSKFLNQAPISSTDHNGPHLAHALHVIRYKRAKVKSSTLSHSGP